MRNFIAAAISGNRDRAAVFVDAPDDHCARTRISFSVDRCKRRDNPPRVILGLNNESQLIDPVSHMS